MQTQIPSIARVAANIATCTVREKVFVNNRGPRSTRVGPLPRTLINQMADVLHHGATLLFPPPDVATARCPETARMLSDAELDAIPILAELRKVVAQTQEIVAVVWADDSAAITLNFRAYLPPPAWWIQATYAEVRKAGRGSP